MNCKTEPYRPFVFTAQDDNSVGAVIDGSTGTLTRAGYGGFGLMPLGSSTVHIKHGRISYLRTGLGYVRYVSDLQFISCGGALEAYNTVLRNCLITDVDTAWWILDDGAVAAEHLTVANCNALGMEGGLDGPFATATMSLTNSLLISVTNLGNVTTVVTQNVEFITNSSVFQSVGAGSYYLADSSPYRDAGTTNISTAMLARLKKTTTHPPSLLTNLSTNALLTPVVSRDVDLPDLGYHYDPLDYVVTSVTGQTVTVTNGTAIAFYGGDSKGISAQTFVSEGAVENMNHLVWYNTVQESSSVWSSTNSGNLLSIDGSTSVRARFTHFGFLAAPLGYSLVDSTNGGTAGTFTFEDCRFSSGLFRLQSLTNVQSLAGHLYLTNNLFDRVNLRLQTIDNPLHVYAFNNHFNGGGLVIRTQEYAGEYGFTFIDNFFNRVSFSQSATVTNSHNAYYAMRLQPTNIHDVVFTSAVPRFTNGPLGNFYHASTNALNKGSRTGARAGLYHYTTTVDQLKETNSIVDIGFHYVSLDSQTSLPMDIDADGFADFQEDVNGNGIWNSGENDWNNNILEFGEVVREKLASGYNHNVFLQSDGTVLGWGYNLNSQVGDGSKMNRSLPVNVTNLSDVKWLSASELHSIAVKHDGTVWGWGSRANGRLGDGATTPEATNAVQASISNVMHVAAGTDHSLALKQDGTVWAWGVNSYGRLGDGTATQRAIPVQVGTNGAYLTNIISISAGESHNLALKADGTVWAWGHNTGGKVGDGGIVHRTNHVQVGTNGNWLTEVIAISAGRTHSLAIKADGTVWAWGDNANGRLGDGFTTDRYLPILTTNLSGVVAVAAGYNHSLALKEDGTVWAWGLNAYGQLGDGTLLQRTVPTQVVGLTNAVAIAAGEEHSVALLADGQVVAWGHTQFGQLGNGKFDYWPTFQVVAKGYVRISAGYNHNLALSTYGTLSAWGYNVAGQIGDGFKTNRSLPVSVVGLTNIIGIDGGELHSLAVESNGVAWAWGDNASSKLGVNGADRTNAVPVGYIGNYLVDVRILSGGASHTLGLKNDGTVWAWGLNSNGRLGDGTATSRTNPVQVGTNGYFLEGIVTITAGDAHNLAVASNGNLFAWGNNSNGRLGDGTTTHRTNHVQIGTNVIWSTNETAVSAGGSHSLAISTNGSVYSWGNNGNGRLGLNHTSTGPTIPTLITNANLTNIVAVSAGMSHSLALRGDGTVWAWGLNTYGQLGDGTTAQQPNPVQVVGLSNVVAIGAGEAHSIALQADGAIVAWGHTQFGQVGVGNVGFNTTPLPVIVGAPIITEQPQSQIIATGANVMFSATAVGIQLQYQWLKDGVNIAGATQASLSLFGVQAEGAGQYQVKISNPSGTTSSTIATLVVMEPPLLTTQPQAQSVSEGDTVILSAIGEGGLPLTYRWQRNGVNLSNGSGISGVDSMTLTIQPVTSEHEGTYTLWLSNAVGTAVSAPAILEVASGSKDESTITFAPIAAKTFGNPPFGIAAVSSAELPVTFSVVAGNATISGNIITLTGAGQVTVRAATAATSQFYPQAAEQSFVVAKANQTISFPTVTDVSAAVFPVSPTLKATATSGLPVIYELVVAPTNTTLSGSSLTVQESGILWIRATQPGNANYHGALSVDRIFRINSAGKQSQDIVFDPGATPSLTYGSSFTPVASATASGPVSFFVISGPGALASNTITCNGVGTIKVRAFHPGDATYNPAYKDQSYTVGKAPQTIDFPAVSNQTYGDSITLVAVASSGLPTAYVVKSTHPNSTAKNAIISGNTLTVTGMGVVTVEAIQAGNALYLAAQPVTRTFAVIKRPISVLADSFVKAYGTPNPIFTVSYGNLAPRDTAPKISGAPVLTASAATGSDVGDYSINIDFPNEISSWSSDFYSFDPTNFFGGMLTIVPATLTAKPIDTVRAAGATNPLFLGIINGFAKESSSERGELGIGAEGINDTNPVSIYRSNGDASSPPGEYVIERDPAKWLNDPNSRLVSVTGKTNYNTWYYDGVLGVGENRPFAFTFGHAFMPILSTVSTSCVVSIAPEVELTSFNYDGGTLRVTLVGGYHASDKLSIESTVNWTQFHNGKVLHGANKVEIGQIASSEDGLGGPLSIVFDGDQTAITRDSVKEVIARLTYQSTAPSSMPEGRSIEVSWTEADGDAHLLFSKSLIVENQDCVGGQALDIAMVLDASGSFAGVQDSARQLTADFISKLGSNDRASVIFFSGQAAVAQGLTTDLAEVRSTLLQSRLYLHSNTDILGLGDGVSCADNGLGAAMAEFSAHPSENRQRVIVLVSDGAWGSYKLPHQVGAQVKAAGVRIVTIGSGGTGQRNMRLLSSSPWDTYEAGGSLQARTELLREVYAKIAGSLCRGSMPPELTFAGTATYVENQVPIRLDNMAGLTDEDSTTLSGGYIRVSISQNVQPTDHLDIANGPNVTVSGSQVLYGGTAVGEVAHIENGTLRILLGTTCTPVIAEEILRHVVFYSASENPSSQERRLDIVVADGSGNAGGTATCLVTVVPINDAPTLSIGTESVSVSAGKGEQVVELFNISGGPDGETGYPLQVAATITGDETAFATGGAPAIVYTSPGTTGTLHFTPATTLDGSSKVAQVTITVKDQDGLPGVDLFSRNLQITVNESGIFSVSAAVAPGHSASPRTERLPFIIPLTVTQSFGVEPITYEWTVVSAPGAVSFIPENTSANPSAILFHPGEYRFRVTGTDNGGQIAESDVLINLTKARVFTTEADFEEGTLYNVNSDTPGQLAVNDFGTSLPFLCVPFTYKSNSDGGDSGSIVRIDVNTGAILGEYLTAPKGNGRNPYGIAIDKAGNVWVSNANQGRNTDPSLGNTIDDGQGGSITRIGLVVGGTRGRKNPDGSFSPDVNGEYVRPPFLYNTCVDRDGDGLIRTSRGLGQILPWTNNKGTNVNVDSAGDRLAGTIFVSGVQSADDEAIINYTRVAGNVVLTLAIDRDGRVWTGGTDDGVFQAVDGFTGLPLANKIFRAGFGGHSGIIDGNNHLWSHNHGIIGNQPDAPPSLWADLSQNPIVPRRIRFFDIQAQEFCEPSETQGIAVNPPTGRIWINNGKGGTYLMEVVALEEMPDGDIKASVYIYRTGLGNIRLLFDDAGKIWTSANVGFGYKLFKYEPADAGEDLTSKGVSFELPCQYFSWGVGDLNVALDANRKLWAITESKAIRIDLNLSEQTNEAVDMVVPFGGDVGATMFGDPTGFSTFRGSRSGTWNVMYDDHLSQTRWSRISWNTEETSTGSIHLPAGSSITVEVRAAETMAALTSQSFVPVVNGESLVGRGITGRFIEARVQLEQGAATQSPILTDLVIESDYDNEQIEIPASCASNLLPLAVDDEVVALRNAITNTTIKVLDNDQADVGLSGNANLFVESVGSPRNGIVQISDDRRRLAYIPEPGFSGSDRFFYTVVDQCGAAARAWVRVEVPAGDLETRAVDDMVAVTVAEPSAPVRLDVLRNDLNKGSKPLHIRHVLYQGGVPGTNEWVSTGQGAVRVINGDAVSTEFCPAVEYEPSPGALGTDEFHYTIVDQYGTNYTARVVVNIRNPLFDRDLVAPSIAVQAEPGVPKSIMVIPFSSLNEWRGAVVTNVTPDVNHSGNPITFGERTVTYTAGADFAGAESFSYTLQDRSGAEAVGDIRVFVNTTTNTNPGITVAEMFEVKRNSRRNLVFDVQTNAYDFDLNLIEIVRFTPPEHGHVVLDKGRLLYTPTLGYTGNDAFTFWVADYEDIDGNRIHKGGLAEAVVNINVVRDVPVLPIAEITKPVSADYSAGGIAANYPRVTEGLLTVEGTASHPADGAEVSYELAIYSRDGQELFRENKEGAVTNGVLGQLDLTRLRNGVYDLWLTVDGDGEITETSARFILDSDLKIGQFTFSEQDVVIPGRGMPLTIVRTYDSLNPNKGEFGIGWTYAINSMDVELDEFRETVLNFTGDEEGEAGGYFSMRSGGGRNVTLTMPDGRRSTFLFTLVRAPDDEFGFGYVPKYIAPPGISAVLEATDEAGNTSGQLLNVVLGGIIPPYWQGSDMRSPEESYDFPGFKLTMEDGTKYFLTRMNEGLHTVVQHNQTEPRFGDYPTFNVRTWSPSVLTRIEHSDGTTNFITKDRVWEVDSSGNEVRALYFDRTADGRITGVYDPSAMDYQAVSNRLVLTLKPEAIPLVKYNYDTGGRLRSVEKLVEADHSDPSMRYRPQSSYTYNPTFPSYISRVHDGRGVPLVRNEYYTSTNALHPADIGALKSVLAADGTLTTFVREYDANNFREKSDPARDGTGANGNDQEIVVQQTITVFPVYAGGTVTGDAGIATVHQTDARGNVIYSFDASDNKTGRTYDQFNNLVEERRFVQGSNATDRSKDIVTTYERSYKEDRGKITAEVLEEIVTSARNASGDLLKTKTVYVDNLPTKTIDAKNIDTSSFYTTNIYNENGLLLEVRAVKDSAPTLISKQVYHTGDLAGYLNYSEDATGTKTYNEYYDGSDLAHGRFGDVKRVYVVDASGETLSDAYYQYDRNGNRTNEMVLRKSGDTDPVLTTNIYDLQNRPVRVNDAEGGVSKTFYNALGKVSHTEDKYGNQTHYVYGLTGELIKTTYPDGSISRTVTCSVYDGGGTTPRRLKQMITEEPHYPLGHPQHDSTKPIISTRSVSDEIGRAIYNERLRGAGISEVPVTQADFVGLTTALLEPVTNTTFTASNVEVLFRTTTVYNPAGQVDHTEQTYFDEEGEPVSLPQTTSYKYDGNGRRKEVVVVTGTGLNQKTVRTVYEYDANGNQREVYTIASASDPNANDLLGIKSTTGIQYEYDEFNRVTNTIHQQLGNEAENERYTTKTRYDIAGRRIEEIDKAGVGTAFLYDGLGRLIAVTNAYRAFSVDGVTPLATPPRSEQVVTRYQYDWVGNMTAQIDANESVKLDAGAAYAATRFEYDKLGRRTKRSLPAAPSTGSQYEIAVYDPADPTDSDETDGQRRLHKTVHTDFNGVEVTSSFDKMGRLEQRGPTGGAALPTGGNISVSYTYYAGGKRRTMTDALGVTEYTYDDFGRLATKEASFNSFEYDYDQAGNLKALRSATSGGNTNHLPYDVSYRWDELNRLKQVFWTSADQEQTEYTYDSFGNLDTVSYPVQNGNGAAVNTKYIYDHQHRLVDMYVKRGLGSGAVTLAHYDYNTAIPLSRNGNRRSAIETINGSTRTVQYDYDNLYRLTKETILPGATPAGNISYLPRSGSESTTGYDLVGNRRSRDVNLSPAVSGFSNQDFGFDLNDRLTGIGNQSDANGNTLLGDVPTGAVAPTTTSNDEYDYNNRLIRRSDGTNTIEIVYDGDGNRVKKKVTTGGVSTWTHFVVDTSNPTGYAQVLEEYGSDDGTNWYQNRIYLYGHDLISQRWLTESGTERLAHFYGYDGHGNVRFLVDSDAHVSDTYTYDAFGTLIQSTGSSLNRYLYCGEQWDPDLGFYYLRARYMNPNSGRFWTMDGYEGAPSDPRTLHKYMYGHADPIQNVDPSGLFSRDFGELAHSIIAGRYMMLHPGTIINPPTGVLGHLKPDILNGPGRVYAEIKPLSFPGITLAWVQMEAYDNLYQKLGFSREVRWPRAFETAFLAGHWIVYFNVEGIIFYSDATDYIDDLKEIKDQRSAFRVLRGLVKKNYRAAIGWARKLAFAGKSADSTRLQTHTGIAINLSLMGKL